MATRKTRTTPKPRRSAAGRSTRTTKERRRDRSMASNARRNRNTSKVARKSRRILWRTVRGTAKGSWHLGRKYMPRVYHGSKASYARWSKRRRFEPGYEADPGEIPAGKFSLKPTFNCCGRRYATPEALNEHYRRVHEGERVDRAPREQPTLVISRTARSKNKRHVRPVAGTPSGRHRHSGRKAHEVRVEALIERHRKRIEEIGRKAVENESNGAALVYRGLRALSDERPKGLQGIEAIALGMERACGMGEEATQEIRAHLLRLNFDPDFFHANLLKIEELWREMARRHTIFIESLKGDMAQQIAEAKQRQEGQRVSDEVLTS